MNPTDISPAGDNGGDQADKLAMSRLVAGKDSALDELMARHAERLFHYLIRLLQDETQASDLAQETFVRVYLNRESYKPAHKFSTWLYTIATNLVRDLKRYQSRRPNVSLDQETTESGQGLAEILPEDKPSPAQTLETSERAESVRRAIAALPEDLRTPLILSVYEDKSHAEIGEILDCSAKSVEMRLYRARQALRAVLEPVHPGSGSS
jgi:RNA polymerase sigma-70 factor (ECF subfamily)